MKSDWPGDLTVVEWLDYWTSEDLAIVTERESLDDCELRMDVGRAVQEIRALRDAMEEIAAEVKRCLNESTREGRIRALVVTALGIEDDDE